MAVAPSFHDFIVAQLDDLGRRLSTEYGRLHGSAPAGAEGGADLVLLHIASKGQEIKLPRLEDGKEFDSEVVSPADQFSSTRQEAARHRAAPPPSAMVRPASGDHDSPRSERSFEHNAAAAARLGDEGSGPPEPASREQGARSAVRSWLRVTPPRFTSFRNLPHASPIKFASPIKLGAIGWNHGSESRDLQCSRSLVIYPGNRLYHRTWCYMLTLLVAFNVFFIPFHFAFYEDFSSGAEIVDNITEVLFVIDLLLTFNVAVPSKSGLVVARLAIARRYVASYRFWVDLAATVPWDTVRSLVAAEPLSKEAAAALQLLRLLRVYRLLLLFRDLQGNTAFNLLGVVVAKFVLFILLCTHTSGCVFYALARAGSFGDQTWIAGFAEGGLLGRSLATRYMHVLFWAVGTFKAGPVAGDLKPTSNSEMLLAVLTMMVNIGLHTYLVGNMAALLTTADVRIYALRHQLRQLYEFAGKHKLDRDLLRQVRSFIMFKFQVDQELDQNVLQALPEIYRQRISHSLYEDVVRAVDLFSGCSSIWLRQLHGALKATLFMPDQILATHDEPSAQLQILAEGEVSLCERNNVVIDTCRRGDAFSAVAFLCKVGQPLMVRTRTLCRVLALDRASWDSACSLSPESMQQVKANLLVFCRQKRDEFPEDSPGFRVYQGLTGVVETHLLLQRETAIAVLLSAAARGDFEETKRLLLGQSPNCANNDNRTPLHLAAAGGRLQVLGLLLEKRAAIDAVDNFGRTPLLEACRSRQDKAAALLFAQGAALSGHPPHSVAPQGQLPGDEGGLATARRVSTDTLGTKAASEADRSVEAGELCQAASDVESLWYLRLLLTYGADPNIGDYDARTPLHVACASGNRHAVELLTAQPGTNLSPSDNFGRTPLMEAVRHSHEACARLLKAKDAEHGFLVDLRNSDNPNAIPAGQELCQAAFANQVTYLHNLITYCSLDVDAADYDLRTALMLACAEGNMDAAVSLVQLRADIGRKDRWGHTAITEARDHGHGDLADVLKRMNRNKSTGTSVRRGSRTAAVIGLGEGAPAPAAAAKPVFPSSKAARLRHA